jgi:hypothetical protein
MVSFLTSGPVNSINSGQLYADLHTPGCQPPRYSGVFLLVGRRFRDAQATAVACLAYTMSLNWLHASTAARLTFLTGEGAAAVAT